MWAVNKTFLGYRPDFLRNPGVFHTLKQHSRWLGKYCLLTSVPIVNFRLSSISHSLQKWRWNSMTIYDFNNNKEATFLNKRHSFNFCVSMSRFVRRGDAYFFDHRTSTCLKADNFTLSKAGNLPLSKSRRLNPA